MPSRDFTFWAVIPAAGSARRMNSPVSKQYLSLAGRHVIEWSMAPFLDEPACMGVMVVLAAEDEQWARLAVARHPRVMTTLGGAQRADSVLAGLHALSSRVQASDWVAVHDAARPCLSSEDLARLIEAVREHEVGGLLASPVTDTLKRADSQSCVDQTVSREALWHALTPQMFRYGMLLSALTQAAAQGMAVTDESQAIELQGARPRLVRGSAENLKITVPDDLARAQRILAK